MKAMLLSIMLKVDKLSQNWKDHDTRDIIASSVQGAMSPAITFVSVASSSQPTLYHIYPNGHLATCY